MDIVAICLVVTALLAYINHRFVGLPTVIGVMSIALILSEELQRKTGRGQSHDAARQ